MHARGLIDSVLIAVMYLAFVAAMSLVGCGVPESPQRYELEALRPDDEQIARIVAAWESAGIETQTQVKTPNGGRCDLVAAGHAWEVEFDDLGVGGVGQAAFYAADLGLKPGVVLVRRSKSDRYAVRARLAADEAGVTLLEFSIGEEIPLPVIEP